MSATVCVGVVSVCGNIQFCMYAVRLFLTSVWSGRHFYFKVFLDRIVQGRL